MKNDDGRTHGEDIAMIREMQKIGEVWKVKFASGTERYVRWRARKGEDPGAFGWQHIMDLEGDVCDEDEYPILETERNKGLEKPVISVVPNAVSKMVEIRVNAKIGDADVEITVPIDANSAVELCDSIGVALANIKTLVVPGN